MAPPTTRAFSETGLRRLRDNLARHCDSGRPPGLVLGLTRGDEVVIDAIGSADADRRRPMEPDAVFRITSMTRPVTGVATLLLVDDGTLKLDDPIDDLLPELAHRQVLRRLDGPLDDTVPARRPITVDDLLSFRGGFGMILAPPSEYPILEAEQALELRCVGPPTPATPHHPDEWMRRLGSLPLMDQPGEQWRYCTGSMILGVLISRACGRPVEEFYRERIFEPLGMHDTGFWVAADRAHRLAPAYLPDGDGVSAYDDGGHWLAPPPFADAGAGLVSTVADYLSFARMLLAGGVHDGQRVLSAELVAAMITDQLGAGQRATAGPLLDGRGWGYQVSIIDRPDSGAGAGPKGYGWMGGYGTTWVNDPSEDLGAVMFTQVLTIPGSSTAEDDFWSGVYAALA